MPEEKPVSELPPGFAAAQSPPAAVPASETVGTPSAWDKTKKFADDHRTVSGAAAGAVVGSVVPVVGTIAGAVVGGVIGFFSEKKDTK